jgi:hypothetical protein
MGGPTRSSLEAWPRGSEPQVIIGHFHVALTYKFRHLTNACDRKYHILILGGSESELESGVFGARSGERKSFFSKSIFVIHLRNLSMVVCG